MSVKCFPEQDGFNVVSYEIKTTRTLSSGLFRGLNFYKKLNPDNSRSVLVYTGSEETNRYGTSVCLSGVYETVE